MEVLALDDGGWRQSSDVDGRARVAPLDVTLDLAALYRGVEFPDPATLPRPAPRAASGGA